MYILFIQIDGKTKVHWTNAPGGMVSCYVCGATPRQMGKRHGKFTPREGTCECGFSPLHARMRAFEWFCKTAIYSEIRSYQCLLVYLMFRFETLYEHYALFLVKRISRKFNDKKTF